MKKHEKTITATEFKAKCLRLLDDLEPAGLIITKRGRPVARVLPVGVVPITLEIAVATGRLDFRSDPADEIIAATSLVEGFPLLTRDSRILESKTVPLAG